MTNKTKANYLLIIITILYGSSFIFTKAVTNVGLNPSFIVFTRGIIFLCLTVLFFYKDLKSITKKEFLIGSVAGLLNFGGYFFQTLGIKYTSPSNNAFLTGTNALFVPLAVFLFYGIKPSKKVFISLPLGLLGIGILSKFRFNNLNSFNIGDIYSLICAIMFGALLAYLGYTAKKISFKKISFMIALYQIAGGAIALTFEGTGIINPNNLFLAIISIIYLGIFCSFGATSLQVYAQKSTTAVTTALIMTLEGVFAGVFSVLFGFENFSISLLIGGLLIFSAVIILEFNFKKIKNKLTLPSIFTKNSSILEQDKRK